MITNNINNINFKAKYIDTAIIKKRNMFVYKPISVNIVEFDRNNSTDIMACRKVISDFGNMMKSDHPEGVRFWGLTTQKDNFDKIDPNSFLGIMKFFNIGYDEMIISTLQTKPETQYSHFGTNREFKGVGKALIEKIKSMKGDKTIRLVPLLNVIPFYEKLGFLHENNDVNSIWMYFK